MVCHFWAAAVRAKFDAPLSPLEKRAKPASFLAPIAAQISGTVALWMENPPHHERKSRFFGPPVGRSVFIRYANVHKNWVPGLGHVWPGFFGGMEGIFSWNFASVLIYTKYTIWRLFAKRINKVFYKHFSDFNDYSFCSGFSFADLPLR